MEKGKGREKVGKEQGRRVRAGLERGVGQWSNQLSRLGMGRKRLEGGKEEGKDG